MFWARTTTTATLPPSLSPSPLHHTPRSQALRPSRPLQPLSLQPITITAITTTTTTSSPSPPPPPLLHHHHDCTITTTAPSPPRLPLSNHNHHHYNTTSRRFGLWVKPNLGTAARPAIGLGCGNRPLIGVCVCVREREKLRLSRYRLCVCVCVCSGGGGVVCVFGGGKSKVR